MTRLVNPVTRGDYGEGSKEGLLNILLHFSFLAPRSSLGFSLFPRGGVRGRFFFQKVFRERRGIIIVSGWNILFRFLSENMRVYLSVTRLKLEFEFGKIRLTIYCWE